MSIAAKLAPFRAEPSARVRLLLAAAVQMRSRFWGLPAAIIERSSLQIDPARRVNPAAMSYQADTAGGGAGGGGGGGGAGDGGAGAGGHGGGGGDINLP